MRQENKARRYRGTYTTGDGKKHNINVKIHSDKILYGSLLAVIGMAGVITINHMLNIAIDGAKKTFGIEDKRPAIVAQVDTNEIQYNSSIEVTSASKQQIEHIISEKPHILKDISQEEYTVSYGDTLSAMAEYSGNTIKRICELNAITENRILQPGEKYTLEVIRDKNETDMEIAGLESYFYDYVFKSQTAANYRNLIFGKSTNSEIDDQSIYGKFIKLYTNFHSEIIENLRSDPEEVTSHYISSLKSLCREVEKINSGNEFAEIATYAKYKIYLKNGTTQFEELNDSYHSIYK